MLSKNACDYMVEIIIAIAVIGSILAGIWDLKTTEVPDEIPLLMTALGIFYWFVQMISNSNYFPFLISITTGTFIALIGYLLYRAGKWGGADAFIFAAIAYMIPVYNGRVFIIDYALNFMIVSAVYMLVYSLALGFMKPRVFRYFFADLKKSGVYVIGLPALYFSMLLATQKLSNAFVMYGILITFLLLFWRYALVIEENVFKKKVSVARLRQGDVLEKMIWRGLTKEEIKEIRKKEKYVIIKEGVRFVPAFAINLMVTLFYGNVLFLIFPL